MSKCTVVCFKSTKGYQNGETTKGNSVISLANRLFSKVDIFSTEDWKKNPIKSFFSLKNKIKNSSHIFIVLAINGATYLGKYLSGYCSKRGIKLFYFMVGIGPLKFEYCGGRRIKQVDQKAIRNYFRDEKMWVKSESKFSKIITRFDHVFVESKTIENVCRKIYGVKNISTLVNFRPDCSLLDKSEVDINDGIVKFVYFARINREKGFFDLIQIMNELDEEGYDFILDVFGSLQVSEESVKASIKSKKISYRGAYFDDPVKLLSNYDCLVFPTKSFEGMPGTIVESFLAGTPVVSSDFTFSRDMISNNKNGFIFPFENYGEMKILLTNIICKPAIVRNIRNNVLDDAKRYLESASIEIVERVL